MNIERFAFGRSTLNLTKIKEQCSNSIWEGNDGDKLLNVEVKIFPERNSNIGRICVKNKNKDGEYEDDIVIGQITLTNLDGVNTRKKKEVEQSLDW